MAAITRRGLRAALSIERSRTPLPRRDALVQDLRDLAATYPDDAAVHEGLAMVVLFQISAQSQLGHLQAIARHVTAFDECWALVARRLWDVQHPCPAG